jgi:hypothetical protein
MVPVYWSLSAPTWRGELQNDRCFRPNATDVYVHVERIYQIGGRKFCYGFLSRAYVTIEINAYELLYACMAYKYIPSDGKSIDK